jgi:hypothetical protein
MRKTLLVLSLLAAAAFPLLPTPAAACSDSTGVHSARFGLGMGHAEPWTRENLMFWARFARGIEALLPAGVSANADAWSEGIRLCPTGETCADDAPSAAWTSTESLFDAVARLANATPTVVARARSRDARVFTLQAFATYDRADTRWPMARLGRLIMERPAEDLAPLDGFLSVRLCGQTAADFAHVVVEEKDAAARPIHRVLVGAFLDTRAAEKALRVLRVNGFPDAFVRPF